mgnify:CR=1 FL=1
MTDLSKLRVLVVDDNPVDRLMIKTLLETIGVVNIQEAENGNIALFKYKNAETMKKQFHMIISDWRMPSQDGLSILKNIRTESKNTKIGIIIATSLNDHNHIQKAVIEGVDDFIIKPVDPAIFAEKVKNLAKKVNPL